MLSLTLLLTANAIAYAIANAIANAIAYANPYAYNYAIAYANPYAYAIEEALKYIQDLDKLPEVFKDVDFSRLITKLKTLKTEIPDNQQPREIRKEFGLKIIKTLQLAFHLTPEIIHLSRQEVKEIDNNYFYIYNLILKCKTAALSVNNQTWNEIEDRMLRVPQN